MRKLVSYHRDENDRFAPLVYFVGRVKYLSTATIEEFLGKHSFQDLACGGQSDRFAQTLLMKREAFSHEEEIRLLANVTGVDCAKRIDPINEDLFRLPIDPNALIDEVLVDPRLTEVQTHYMIAEVRRCGYMGVVKQSELYRFTPRPIRFY